jgi:hypothetical protein
MRTLRQWAQDGGGGDAVLAAETVTPIAASEPLIKGAAENLWIGAGVILALLVLLLILMIRSRVIRPARRKADTTQFFEAAGADMATDTAFDESGAAAGESTDDDSRHARDLYAAPENSSPREGDPDNFWNAPVDADYEDLQEPAPEAEKTGPFASLFSGESRDAVDAIESPGRDDADEFSQDRRLPRERRENALAAARFGDDPGLRDGIAAMLGEFAQSIAKEFDSLRVSTQQSIDGLARRLDRLSGGQPEEMAALAREIAQFSALLSDKPAAMTAAGRIQLADLIRTHLPAAQYSFSVRLAAGRTADCLIRSPSFPAPVAIDARFPVEAFDQYRRGRGDPHLDSQARAEYRRTVIRHIVDIAENLIVPGETANFAIMFAPSETIANDLFAEFSDVVQDSYRAKVWILSPTSLMASLYMMSAVTNPADQSAPAQGAQGGQRQRPAKSAPKSAPESADDDLPVRPSQSRASEERREASPSAFPLRSAE